MKEKPINFFKKAWERLTCRHVYIQSCTKCGHKRVTMTYEEPVEPQNRKR